MRGLGEHPGVSYVGGYPGAPISHLLDVLADANDSLLTPLGIYYELSGSEAAAAALLGASIDQLSDTRRRDVEVGRRHERGVRCALTRRFRRGPGRCVGGHRRGLW